MGPIGQIGASTGHDFLIVCNLNNDGYDDVVMYSTDGVGLIQWWGLTNDGTGLLTYSNPGTSTANFGLDNGGDTPFMADVNGDGYDDICVRRAAPDGSAQWYTGFTTESIYPGEMELYAGATGDDHGNFGSAFETGMFAKLDTTNDQDDIVVTTLGSAGTWSGSRTLLAPVSLHGNLDTELYLPLPSEIFDPMLGDVDGDGVDDIVLREPDNGNDSDPNAKPAWNAYLSDVDAKGRGSFSAANKTSIPQFAEWFPMLSNSSSAMSTAMAQTMRSALMAVLVGLLFIPFLMLVWMQIKALLLQRSLVCLMTSRLSETSTAMAIQMWVSIVLAPDEPSGCPQPVA